MSQMKPKSGSWYYDVSVTTSSPGVLTASATTAVPDINITVNGNGAEPEPETLPDTSWEGVLAIEGHPTPDKRYLIPGAIDERELPIPLMVQTVNDEGHKSSELGGRIDSITRIPASEFSREGFDMPELPDNAVIIWAEGIFDGSEAGQDGPRLIEDGGGVSLDLSVTEASLLDPETYEPVDPEELDLMQLLFGGGDFLTGFKGTIMGATAVPFAAFPEAKIVLTASGTPTLSIFTNQIRVVRPVITASAAGLAPFLPPLEWFEMPEETKPTPLTVTEDGRVFGHLALWNQCHTGYQGVCQMPPRSPSDYKFFHLGAIETDDGSLVSCGKITVGTPHAPISYGSVKTQEHYDNTGCVAAFVRAKDGMLGIWLSGVVRSDVPKERIRDLRANPPSGDWRTERGALELQGILAVPIPGYPVPRQEARLVASGQFEEVEALVATGFAAMVPCPHCGEMMSADGECDNCGYDATGVSYDYEGDGELTRRELRFRAMLADARAELEWERDSFAYTAEQRRKMAKSGEALPDGSFPIANCADAERAIHAQGRASSQDRAVAHIKKRVRALGCTGDIFDNYK